MRLHGKIIPGPFAMILLLGCMVQSCALKGVNQKQMIYTTSDRQEVRINLPGGRGEENFKTNLKGAIEQYFTYEDSSLIYVARNTTWPTPNGSRVKQEDAKKGRFSVYYNGTDSQGLFWKEVHIEDFKVGYMAVSASRVEVFDRALNSIRIK